jgi:hypothetical protein
MRNYELAPGCVVESQRVVYELSASDGLAST